MNVENIIMVGGMIVALGLVVWGVTGFNSTASEFVSESRELVRHCDRGARVACWDLAGNPGLDCERWPDSMQAEFDTVCPPERE